MKIINQSCKEAKNTRTHVNSMSKDIHKQKVKKAAVVALISLKREAQTKNSKEIETEIRKALRESLSRIPWLVLENVIVAEE